MKFPQGIQMYLEKSSFENLSEEEIIIKVHEMLLNSTEVSNAYTPQNIKVYLLLHIQSKKDHVMYTNKIFSKISPLNSNTFQILTEKHEAMLDNFFLLDINAKLLEAYTKIYNENVVVKDKYPCEVDDDEEDKPPSNYGDPNDDRTYMYVINKESLEKDFNITRMDFFKSNMFNHKSGCLINIQGSRERSFIKDKGLNKRNMNEFDSKPTQEDPTVSKKKTKISKPMNQTGKNTIKTF